jgi:hypothetical protein
MGSGRINELMTKEMAREYLLCAGRTYLLFLPQFISCTPIDLHGLFWAEDLCNSQSIGALGTGRDSTFVAGAEGGI